MKSVNAGFLITALLLTGCSTFEVATSQKRKEIQDNAKDTIEGAKTFEPKFGPMARINEIDAFYAPKLQAQEKEKPDWYFKKWRGNYRSFTLNQFMLMLQDKHGVNMRYLDGLDGDKKFSMIHDGTVGEALDKVQLATAYGYTVEGDVITWSKYITDFIDISTFPGIESYRIGKEDAKDSQQRQQGMGNTIISDTGISDDGSYSSLLMEENSPLASILTTANMLKSQEGTVTVDYSTTSLVIRDYPENVRRVRNFIKQQNTRLTAQAVFDIMIVDYVKSQGDEVAVNFEVIKNDLASSGIQALSTNFASSLVSSITPTVFTYTKKEGKYAGATAFIESLKSRGAVLNVINPSLVVTNNRVSKIVDSADRSYLASAGSSATANVGQTEILIPGIVKTGLQLWALADIDLNEGSVFAKVANSFSDLVEIESASSGNATIQTPSTNSNEFDQTFHIKDGETILLGGLGTSRQEVTENTGGTLGLGGEKGTRFVETETLILITPRIIRK
ncbi:hypothetical protein [Alteromonas antoniana]|uniref:hypothetical protein n=1 Tax=Alteromonas antoniana TaxID=2803813 RepID=UPI001C43C9A9|nr:hypothetical protein [Alteromonas antoniana]